MAFKNKLASLAGGAAVALSVFSFSSADAAVFSIVGGTPIALPGNFNPSNAAAMAADGVGVGTVVNYYTSASPVFSGLYVSPDPVNLTFTFMGKEADFVNAASASLTFLGSPLFLNTDAPGTTSATVTYFLGGDPGLVPFSFHSLTSGRDGGNGGGFFISPGATVAFFLTSDPQVAYAFFDDSGAGPDGDFDDMVVKIVAATPEVGETPVPGAVFLFGSVLAAGVGGFHLRRRRAARA